MIFASAVFSLLFPLTDHPFPAGFLASFHLLRHRHTFLELLNAVKNVPATVSSWWKDNLPSVIQAIKDVPLMVSGWWSDHLPEILQAIVDTPTTVWNWWKEQLPDVVNAIIESPKTVLSFWKDFFNEHSFSDILQAIGKRQILRLG